MTVTELCAALTVAPGLDDSTIMTTNWFNNPNGSVYLKYIPAGMNKEDIRAAFAFLGKISRIDIVDSIPYNGPSSTYRMAFIHYDYWYSSSESINVRRTIVSCFPKTFNMYSMVAQHELSITINTRPVQKTEYNVDQLSDMFHRLQEQFTMSLENQEKQAQQIAELKDEVAELKKMNHSTQSKSWLQIQVDGLDKTIERLTSDMDEFTEWADGTASDIQEIRVKQDSKLDEFKADIQRQYVCTESQLSEMKYEVGCMIGCVEKKQEKQDANVSKLNYERSMETREVRAEVRKLREQMEAYNLDELTKDMRAKYVEYSSMSKVFTRDIAELIQIRQKVVPEVVKISAFMSGNPEYQRFCQDD